MSHISIKTGKWEVTISRSDPDEFWTVHTVYIIKPAFAPMYFAKRDETVLSDFKSYEDATEAAREFIIYAKERMRHDLRIQTT